MHDFFAILHERFLEHGCIDRARAYDIYTHLVLREFPRIQIEYCDRTSALQHLTCGFQAEAAGPTRHGYDLSAEFHLLFPFWSLRERYPAGIEVSDAELDAVNLKRARFHGEWTCTLLPGRKNRQSTHFCASSGRSPTWLDSIVWRRACFI